MPKIDHYAVFGHPIEHSKSPQIHTLFAQQTHQLIHYTAQDVPPGQFESAVEAFFSAGGKGLNCTVPLKELAWKIADRKSERALIGKAVNTLVLQDDGSLYGDNTDGIGLVRDLTDNLKLQLAGKRLLLLGAGGAARGILAPLLALQPACLAIANRTLEKALDLAGEFSHQGPVSAMSFEALEGRRFHLILNATAASLQNRLPPLPEPILITGGCCYDLAYGDEPTPFVRWGRRQQAARSVDGLGMLVEQAAEAFQIWRGVRPKTAPVIERLNAERARRRPS